MKLVRKSFNGECTTSGYGPSGRTSAHDRSRRVTTPRRKFSDGPEGIRGQHGPS